MFSAGAVTEYAAGVRLGRFERIVGSDRVPHSAEPGLRNDVAGKGVRDRLPARRFRPSSRIRKLVRVPTEVAPQHGGGVDTV